MILQGAGALAYHFFIHADNYPAETRWLASANALPRSLPDECAVIPAAAAYRG